MKLKPSGQKHALMVKINLSINTDLGNHGIAQLHLNEGWNLYTATVEQSQKYWSHLLAWSASNVSLHATPYLDDPSPWAVSKPHDQDHKFHIINDPKPFTLPEEFKKDSGDISRITLQDK